MEKKYYQVYKKLHEVCPTEIFKPKNFSKITENP